MSIQDLLNTTKSHKLWDINDNDNRIVCVEKKTIDISKKLQSAKPQIKQPLDFKKISNITDTSAREIQRHVESKVRAQHFVIGGSAAAETQVSRHRDPKDLDLHTKNVRREANHIYVILKRNYGANRVQMNPMIRFPDGTRMIQIKIWRNGEWIDAVDVKSIVKPGTLLPSVGIKTKVPIKIGKLNYEQVSELIARKASAMKQNCGEYPKPRCKKDTRDFFKLSKSVAKGKVKEEISELEKSLTKTSKGRKLTIPKFMRL